MGVILTQFQLINDGLPYHVDRIQDGRVGLFIKI